MAMSEPASAASTPETVPAEDARPAGPATPTGSAAPDAAVDDDQFEPDEARFRQDAQTIINVMRLEAATAMLGASGLGQPPSTGEIKPDAISEILRGFCGADAYGQAAKVLAQHGMVVLLGGEGSGRYAAAHALLSDWPSPASAS